ncbi:MAG: hypothetical protein R2828_20150 [Saprospiraceae bacterium]
MKAFQLFIRFSLLGLLLIGLSNCFRSYGERLADGAAQTFDDAFFEKTAQAIARGALQELLSDSTQYRLRSTIDSLLAMTSDSLDEMTKRLTANVMGDYTKDWINARTDQLTAKLDSSLRSIKAELLNEDLEGYLQHLSRDIIGVELRLLTNDLLNDLSGDAMAGRLRQIRPSISHELDSIIQAAMLSLAINSKIHLIPLLDSLSISTGGVIQQAEDTSRSIIRYLLIGSAAVVLIGILVAQWIWKRRYKSMLEVVTKNIDQVPSQKTYDELTLSIKKDMENRGLEDYLREQILEKQKLIEQPEWKDKDAQLMQLIKTELKEEEAVDEDTRSLGPRSASTDDFKTRLKQKAKEVGLADHLESILRR